MTAVERQESPSTRTPAFLRSMSIALSWPMVLLGGWRMGSCGDRDGLLCVAPAVLRTRI